MDRCGTTGFLLVAGALAIGTGWLVPVVGLLAATFFVTVLAPVGVRATQRASAVLVIALATLALLAFMPGLLQLGWVTVRIILTLAVAVVVAARLLVPAVRAPIFPEVHGSDAVGPLAGIVVALMILVPFIGATNEGIVSGLLTSWDLWAHFSFFANTYQAGTTAWTTSDLSGPYGVGYPQLPFVLWTTLQWLVQSSGEVLPREQLLLPYVTWIAVTVGSCATLVTWLAGDVADRLGRASSRASARLLASLALGVVVVVGSFSTYAEAGHANFLLGVTIVMVAAYWALASPDAPGSCGWLIVPGAALCALALWPPLALGVAVSAGGVIVTLWKRRPPMAIAYGLLAIAAITVAGWKYLGILLSNSSVESLSMGGATGGLASYSLPLAIAGPILVLAGAGTVWIIQGWQVAAAIASATMGLIPFTVYLMSSVDAAGTPRLESYFLLKIAGGLVLMATPILIAYLAVPLADGMEAAVARLVARAPAMRPRGWRVVIAGCGSLGLAASFGMVSSHDVPAGFPQAPAFASYQERVALVADAGQGKAVIAAARISSEDPGRTPLFWDNNGVLLTAWTQALSRVRSNADVQAAESLGMPASGNPPVAEFIRLIREQPRMRVLVFWLDEGIFEPLRPVLQQFGTNRVVPRYLGSE